MAKAAEPAASPPKIIWNERESKFETEDKRAYLQYYLRDVTPTVEEDEKRKITVMDMVHTFVPGSKRGLGLANRLCAAAFDHARRNSLFVVPTCSYISDTFLPRNPSWMSVVYSEDLKSSM
ncbi:uncharacterized protein A4U43_C09F9560 [Asparagus officinalis]|uniref:N-acetyltransferase domain-containing protein n=1 Tax=Asparagus officinalis TaxID=4686 RepID=A0A5P1E9M3_ASPOF|nr:acetyltransferase At1g77540-like [Asparagus officinalis]ONK58205.1 uncharacterized protein A4U43_C09F9560 [Asparagus officinalis]